MSRIRTVKPELFKHEWLYEAEIATKLPLTPIAAGLLNVTITPQIDQQKKYDCKKSPTKSSLFNLIKLQTLKLLRFDFVCYRLCERTIF